MEKYRNNFNKLDIMKIHDLEDLVYTASMKSARRAEEMLFGGLMPFFNRLFDENEIILQELQYIKTLLQKETKKEITPEGYFELENGDLFRVDSNAETPFRVEPELTHKKNELLTNAPKLNLIDSLPNVKISDDTLKRLQLAMSNNQLKGDE